LRAVARQSLSVVEIQEIAALPLAMTILFFQQEMINGETTTYFS